MYKIKLQHFEGPLDLLLFFIRRDELDIYDIPIARITKEFVDYLKMMQYLDLEVAGDFILMATTLMQIKVKMLLPKLVDEKGDEIDPRIDLVKALLDYKRYKEMSEELSYMEINQKKRMFRGNFSNDVKESPPDLEMTLKNITLYDLIRAYKKAMEEKPKEVVHEIKKYNVNIEDQIKFIKDLIADKGKATFFELISSMKEKIKIVVTFIAMLELIKIGIIGIRTNEVLNHFEIYGLENG